MQLDSMQVGSEADFVAPVASSKQYIERAFTESNLYAIATEGKVLLESTRLQYPIKVHIFKDIGMVKLELFMNCMEITPLAVENLGLTYDSTLSINLLYEPDVILDFFFITKGIVFDNNKQPEYVDL